MSESTPNPDDRRERLERIARERPEPAAETEMPRPSETQTRYSGDQFGDSNVFLATICGLIFLYTAWIHRADVAIGTPSAAYAASLPIFPWLAGACGAGLLTAAGLGAIRSRAAIVVEFAAALLATLTALVIGLIWMLEGDSEGFLLLIFAAINGHAALTCYRIWRRA